jgi:hypothetical protein
MRLTCVALSAVRLFLGGSFTTMPAQTTGTTAAVGAVEVITATATVEKLALEHRKVTLLLENGKKKTFKVDKRVQNLEQVKVGDQLKLSCTEEILILVGKSGEAPGAAAVGELGVAPKGAKPGIGVVETSALGAKILGVNQQKHQVALEDPDGKKPTINVSSKVSNLDQLKAGESATWL